MDVYVCLHCALIQIADQIPRGYYANYVYVPSVSPTLTSHFGNLAQALVQRFSAGGGKIAVDIGSNDGLLLKAFQDAGMKPIGVDPSTNLCEVARAKGLEAINDYFSARLARGMRAHYGAAAIITTTNTMNSVDDLHDFIDGVIALLADDGVFVIEVPHALHLIEQNEFDTIYHEHLSQFSVRSLVELFQAFDLEIFDIERLSIHGGSIRVFSHRKTGRATEADSIVAEWLAREEAAGLYSLSTYEAFSQRVERNRAETVGLLTKLKSQGKTIAGYGAPAKGNTLLNYYGIGTNTLTWLADRSRLKQGLLSPGMRIPVVDVEKILEERPDYLLVLAWNFADEIISQQREYRNGGGKFIVPIPHPQVL
jgi:SAM-dependent methyltransferase